MLPFFTIFALVVCTTFHEVVRAQDDAVINQLLSDLDSVGLTNFTDVVRQVQADTTQPTFFLSISNLSTPKTLFVPDNDAFAQPNANFFGFPYQANDTAYLASLLLYHLLPGTYLANDLGTGNNHTVVPTTLQGSDFSFLENNKSQAIALGNGGNGSIEVFNQYQTPAVVGAYQLGNITIYALDSIIGIPGLPSFGANFLGLTQFMALQNASGVPDLDSQHGFTVFAPSDQAFEAANSQTASSSPSDIFANHVILGRTIYYPDFQSDVYTSSSGHNFTLNLTADQGYTVTLNSVTANITRSDFITDNGVIHVIDGVLWDTAQDTASPPPTTPSNASKSTSSTSASSAAATTSDPDPLSVTLSTPAPPKLSLGTIVGIVAIVIFVLAIPVVTFMVWRYRRAMKDAHVRHARRFSIFDLPSTAMPTTPFTITPFYANAPASNSSDPRAILSMSDVEFARDSVSGTSNSASPVSQLSPRVIREKLPLSGVTYQPPSPSSNGSSSEIQTSAVPSSRAPHIRQLVAPIPMTAEIVDHLWHEFAQRIDRGPPSRTRRESEAPPTYPSGSAFRL